MRKDAIFGKVLAHVCSIEWQKRGLPHAHILIWLTTPISSHQIDSIISAEIPNKQRNGRLHDIVVENMIHGPCGAHNRLSPCMDQNCCAKDFPKPFAEVTTCGNNGYPLYRRRSPEQGGETTFKKVNNKQILIDNRWVVPYSPYLCDMFDCHINTEVCNSITAIKYVIKYVTKGCDMASFAVQGISRNDEISLYQAARYVSCSEACWRLFGFHIHDRDPTVVRLSVHLPNGQRVLFTEDNAVDVAQAPPETTLTAFFKLCLKYQTDDAQPPTADQRFVQNLLYTDLPQYFIFEIKIKSWKARKKGKAVVLHDGTLTSFKKSSAIGRVYAVCPKQSECFFVRLLLHHRTNCVSFQDLRTVDGEVKSSFRDACLSLGLLEDDAHLTQCQEAEVSASPSSRRTLFAIIITSCNVSNPVELWDTHKDFLTDDILYRARQETNQPLLDFTPDMYNEALCRIEDVVNRICNRKLSDFGLPSPQRRNNPLSNEVLRETSYDVDMLRQYVTEKEPTLTADQRQIYDRVINAVQQEESAFFFIDAPGGTGKTYLINIALAKLRSQRKVALAVATSGIAAKLLANGRTAHSTFKIPLNLQNTDTPVCSIKANSATADLIRSCKAIFWDEATMINKAALEALDRTLRDIRKSSAIFGGIPVILSGDFRQTLPILPGEGRAEQVQACIRHSCLWQSVQKLALSTNIRVHLHNDNNAGDFSQLLLQVGNGEISNVAQSSYQIEMPIELANAIKSVDRLIENVYPDIQNNFRDLEWLMERAILAPHNHTVDEINNCVLDKIPGENVTYRSIDTLKNDETSNVYPTEVLNSLQPPGIPPHILALKVGVRLIVLRNLAPGIANGTRLILVRAMERCLETIVATGPKKGDSFFLPKIPLTPSDAEISFEFTRCQFPVKLAFGMTINKAQGQTLGVAGIHLHQQCFSHGQFYVACSRVSTKENLFICLPPETNVIHNVVYQEVLH